MWFKEIESTVKISVKKFLLSEIYKGLRFMETVIT